MHPVPYTRCRGTLGQTHTRENRQLSFQAMPDLRSTTPYKSNECAICSRSRLISTQFDASTFDIMAVLSPSLNACSKARAILSSPSLRLTSSGSSPRKCPPVSQPARQDGRALKSSTGFFRESGTEGKRKGRRWVEVKVFVMSSKTAFSR